MDNFEGAQALTAVPDSSPQENTYDNTIRVQVALSPEMLAQLVKAAQDGHQPELSINVSLGVSMGPIVPDYATVKRMANATITERPNNKIVMFSPIF